jgi:radical SAM superfamily enzyme YgiQ (UPF0313 family)
MKPRVALISLFNIDFGVRYISSFLGSKGFPADIISFGMLRLKEAMIYNNYLTPGPLRQHPCPGRDVDLLLKALSDLKPGLVGISVPSTSLVAAKILTRRIREELDVPVVWGGLHPTLCPEECIPHTDIVCVGEGEQPMHELAQRVELGAEFHGIRNLWIRREDGSIERNGLRDLITDLDSLPYPDFVGRGNKHLIDGGRLTRDPVLVSGYQKYVFPVMASRGCHHSCAYCCNSVLRTIYQGKGPYLRWRSPENVVDELARARRQREATQVRFWDDILTYDRDWVERFHRLYIERVSIPFVCYAHPKHTDPSVVEMLAKAGLVLIDVGVQSGSEGLCRRRYGRDQSNEQIEEFAELLRRSGIMARYNVLVDDPCESDADWEATAGLLSRLPRPYSASLYSLCHFPKTGLTRQALADGVISEREVEGADNKALNNFYMSLGLTKGTKRLLRNVILAMTVSDFFPETAVRRLANSRFWQGHPRLLLSLVRARLRIAALSPGPILELLRLGSVGGLVQIFRKAPRLVSMILRLYMGAKGSWKEDVDAHMLLNAIENNLDGFNIEGRQPPVETSLGVDLLVSPKERRDGVPEAWSMTVRPGVPGPRPRTARMLIELVGMADFYSIAPERRFGLWELDIPAEDIGAEFEMGLRFPRLIFSRGGKDLEAARVEARDIEGSGLHALRLYLYDARRGSHILKNCVLVRPAS